MWEVFYNSKIMGFITNKDKFFPDNDAQLNCETHYCEDFVEPKVWKGLKTN